MRMVSVGDLELCVETFGDENGEPLLLIAGLGAQMTSWDPAFCKLLVKQGFFVVRFDNRDSGLSSKVDVAVPTDPAQILDGDLSTLAYTLDDMAADVVGLLGALGIERAHLVGASMGAMVAQLVAIHHGERVKSLASIMSTTGNPAVGQPTPEAANALFAEPPRGDRDAVVQHGVNIRTAVASPAYPPRDTQTRAFIERNFERSYYPEGAIRQLAAIITAWDRTEALSHLRVPTLVIHGTDDPLVNVSGGEATAAAVPNAELVLIPGMGHDLPFQLWPRMTQAIAANAHRSV